jgi:hypothetical protein
VARPQVREETHLLYVQHEGGKTLGISAIHYWWLEPRDGKTFVRTEESYEGLVARLFRGRLQKTLDQALADGLRYLRAEVERRTSR